MAKCPQCGSELPAVAYFCPICGLRLQDAEDRPPAPAPPPVRWPPAVEQASEPELPPQPVAPPSWRVPPVSGPQMLGPAFMAGIAGGVLTGVPGIHECGCLWMFGCGALAVFFFYKQFGRAPLANEAAKLGLMTAFFGFVITLGVSFVAEGLIRRSAMGLVESLRDQINRSAELMKGDTMTQARDMANSPGGAVFLVFAFVTSNLFGFLLLSTIGSLLAASSARKRH